MCENCLRVRARALAYACEMCMYSSCVFVDVASHKLSYRSRTTNFSGRSNWTGRVSLPQCASLCPPIRSVVLSSARAHHVHVQTHSNTLVLSRTHNPGPQSPLVLSRTSSTSIVHPCTCSRDECVRVSCLRAHAIWFTTSSVRVRSIWFTIVKLKFQSDFIGSSMFVGYVCASHLCH